MHLKQDKKPSLLWFQGLTCNGNTHSFLNLPNLEFLLNKFEILLHPLLASTQDFETITQCSLECDIFIFEGTYDPLMKRNNVLVSTIVEHYSRNAKYVIALGSCASFGGMFKLSAPERNSGLIFNASESFGPLVEEKNKVINLAGCPVHPEWLAYTLNMIAADKEIEVDSLHRPIEL
jgi:hydrogenase small subunit